MTAARTPGDDGAERDDERSEDDRRDDDRKVDEASEESFPASDAPSFWAGSD